MPDGSWARGNPAEKETIMEIFNIVVLAVSGLLLTFAGGMRLLRPTKSFCLIGFFEKHGAGLEKDASILSEMRGAGTFTLLCGLTLLTGAVMPDIRPTSFVVGIVMFLGYAVGRSVSMALDGKPNEDTVKGLYSEVLFAVLHIVCLVMWFI